MAATDILSGNIVEVRAVAMLGAAFCMNTYHYKCVVAPTVHGTNDVLDFLENFDTDVDELVSLLQSSDLNARQLFGQIIYPTRYAAWPLTPTETIGQVGSPANPSGVSLVIRRRGSLANRHNLGRVFIPGLPQEYTNGNNLHPDGVTPAENLAIQMPLQIPFSTDGYMQQVLLNRVVPANSVVVDFGSYDQELRYQRRREPSVGL